MPPLKSAPGAIDAGTPEFLDFLISVSPTDTQKVYVNGLDRLDAEARQKFDLPFAGVDLQQADALIRPWLRTWMTDHQIAHERFHQFGAQGRVYGNDRLQKAVDVSIPEDDGRRRIEQGLYWYPVDPESKRATRGRD